MAIWMLLAAILNADKQTTPIIKRREPVALRIVEVRTRADGSREAEILLTPDPDVEIYANGPDEKVNPEVEITLTIKGGDRLKSETVLPKPNRVVEEAGMRFYSRTGPTKVLVRFTPPMDETLTLRCTYGAWNSWRSCCLGVRKLETELKLPK